VIGESNLPESSDRNRVFGFLLAPIRQVPAGFAQIMLQPSWKIGIAFLAGVFWNSWVIASFGVLGCISGAFTAVVCGYPEGERRDGLYGFNGALVGLGASYFYESSSSLGFFVAVGGAASAVVMRAMLRRGLKPLTFPFVAVTWLIFLLFSETGWVVSASGGMPSSDEAMPTHALLRGVGQILFQDSILTGGILLVAVTLRDWVQGMYAALATLIGLIGASVFGFPIDALNLGLYGYNGVLCGILFAGSRPRDLANAIAAITLSIVVVRLFHVAELPAFTFPFVLSSWVVIGMTGYLKSRASRI